MKSICSYRLSLEELLSRPAVELRLFGSDGTGDGSGDSGTGGSAGSGDGGDGTGNGNGENQSGDGDKDGSKKPPAEKDSYTPEEWKGAQTKIAALTDEKDRHFSARTAAEQERDAAKAELAELKKNGTSDEKLTTELTTAQSTIAQLTTTVADQAKKLAFLTDNSYDWVDSDAALALVDMSDVEITKEGKVVGLKAALDKLSKAKPALIKPKSDDGGGDGKGGDSKKPPAKSGNAPGNQKSGDQATQAAEKARLEKKYTGLRGR